MKQFVKLEGGNVLFENKIPINFVNERKDEFLLVGKPMSL